MKPHISKGMHKYIQDLYHFLPHKMLWCITKIYVNNKKSTFPQVLKKVANSQSVSTNLFRVISIYVPQKIATFKLGLLAKLIE